MWMASWQVYYVSILWVPLNASVAMNQKGMSARICRWLYLLGIIRRSAVHRWLVWPGCNTNYSTLLIKHIRQGLVMFFFLILMAGRTRVCYIFLIENGSWFMKSKFWMHLLNCFLLLGLPYKLWCMTVHQKKCSRSRQQKFPLAWSQSVAGRLMPRTGRWKMCVHPSKEKTSVLFVRCCSRNVLGTAC